MEVWHQDDFSQWLMEGPVLSRRCGVTSLWCHVVVLIWIWWNDGSFFQSVNWPIFFSSVFVIATAAVIHRLKLMLPVNAKLISGTASLKDLWKQLTNQRTDLHLSDLPFFRSSLLLRWKPEFYFDGK